MLPFKFTDSEMRQTVAVTVMFVLHCGLLAAELKLYIMVVCGLRVNVGTFLKCDVSQEVRLSLFFLLFMGH